MKLSSANLQKRSCTARITLQKAITLIAILSLAACATNPWQNAKFWRIEQCSSITTVMARFTVPDATPIVIPRAACAAVIAAAGKIEGVTRYHADQIWIADSTTPNAFAAKDKSQRLLIVVTLGMLQTLGSDEAAWASLLGHEVAHQVRNHSQGRERAKTDAQQTGHVAGTLIAQFIPGIGGFVAGNAANFAATSAIYGAYTRPQEREADEDGLRWMVAAGYDPRGMERLFTELGKHSSGLPGFLSTHPGADDRAQMVRGFISSSGNIAPVKQ